MPEIMSFNELLFQAVRKGDVTKVTRLIADGTDVNALNSSSRTPLVEAAAYEHPKIVKLLLAHGANPNASDVNGITALMEAASGNDLETMRILLRHGAHVDIQDKFGDTALVYATAQKKDDAVSFLKGLKDFNS